MDNPQLRYVLDDVLEMRYHCNVFERSYIIEEILSRTERTDRCFVQIIEGVLVDGIVSFFGRTDKLNVKECISWRLSKERPLCSSIEPFTATL